VTEPDTRRILLSDGTKVIVDDDDPNSDDEIRAVVEAARAPLR